MIENNSRGDVLVIIKAFELLEIINKEGSVGLSELARKSGFKKPTVARMLNTLKKLGIIDQNKSNYQFFLTMRLVNMANLILEKIDVRQLSRPLIESFVRDHGKSVLLVSYQHPDIVYVDKLLSSEPFSIRTLIGSTVKAAHCTASGKAILAYLNEDEVKRITREKLPSFTINTITTWAELIQDLTITRQRGFAIDNKEVTMCP
jgi:DNA-binding IclR family transcriptional regulator